MMKSMGLSPLKMFFAEMCDSHMHAAVASVTAP